MLILSRRETETIRIGDHIEVYVAEIRGNRVRLGIQAPKEIPVFRSKIIPPHTVTAISGNTAEANSNMSVVPALPYSSP